MKSFTFASLACLMLSASQVEAISAEVDAQVATNAELEHHHVSTLFQETQMSNAHPVDECNNSTEWML